MGRLFYLKGVHYLIEALALNESIQEQMPHHSKEWSHDHWSLKKIVHNTIKMYKKSLALKDGG